MKKEEVKILYADFELKSNDMFVITPDGNYFNFPSPEFNDKHDDVDIVDPRSHKIYKVVFTDGE